MRAGTSRIRTRRTWRSPPSPDTAVDSAMPEENMALKVSHLAARMHLCARMVSPSTSKATSADSSSPSRLANAPSASSLSVKRWTTSRPPRAVKGPHRIKAPSEVSSTSAGPESDLRPWSAGRSSAACSQSSSSQPTGKHQPLATPPVIVTRLESTSSSVMNRNESNHVVHRSRLPRAQAPMYEEPLRRKGMPFSSSLQFT
mmetsp:Transcript_25486/g.85441  ORF Transcript_25486/g.85441 Transcript_25486/m.85441 type:complete len:201 (+) Transcript_25486:721-1323(+)